MLSKDQQLASSKSGLQEYIDFQKGTTFSCMTNIYCKTEALRMLMLVSLILYMCTLPYFLRQDEVEKVYPTGPGHH